MQIPIILETTTYLVLNKPAGIAVHGDGKSDQYTVADWILEKYPDLAPVGEPMELYGKNVLRPGIVHRLDKDTSGCLLIAKNQESYLFFKKQFQEHTIEKIYHAFTYGSIKETQIVIDKPIGRSRENIRRWAVGKQARGELRDAYTSVTVLKRIGVEDEKGSTEKGTHTFVECRPKTGRTHQIRVHLKSINHPIVCDTLYAENREPALSFDRLALHARSLSFTDQEHTKVVIEAPYPPDFEKAVAITK